MPLPQLPHFLAQDGFPYLFTQLPNNKWMVSCSDIKRAVNFNIGNCIITNREGFWKEGKIGTIIDINPFYFVCPINIRKPGIQIKFDNYPEYDTVWAELHEIDLAF